MITPDNRTEMLVKTIQNAIISGVYKSGDKLPPLRNLAKEHHVSRSVVNSAISTLSTKGYISIVPRHYIVINDFLTTGSLTVLKDIFESDNEELKRKMISETLTCRMVVERNSIKTIVANLNINLEPIKSVIERELLWQADLAHDITVLYALDLSFHNSIVALAQNMVFSLIYHQFEYLAKPMIAIFYSNPQVIDFVLDKHLQIYIALKNHNREQALSLIEDLLTHGEQELLKVI
ncbi:MAG: GntR family transcriptional regulator [Candidatus Izemoplasmatales bacterium]|jgi:DNA-binding FadR family transcriptional regulator